MTWEPREYDDFVIEATDLQEDGRFRVRVLRSSVGGMPYKAAALVRCDWDLLTPQVEAWRDRRLFLNRLFAFGRHLANLLLPEGHVRTMYWRARERADSRKRGLRLRLQIEDARLRDLPWELLHLDRGWGELHASDFLALQHATSITRQDVVSPSLEQPPPLAQISLVGMLSNPGGILHLEQEQADIEQAIALINREAPTERPAIEARWIQAPTRRSLDNLWDGGGIFHFAGFGWTKDAENTDLLDLDEYYIVLVDQDDQPDYYPLSELAPSLADVGSRLALINAGNAGPGALQVLARVGIPAAIGEHGMP